MAIETKTWWVEEAEFFPSNFLNHGHPSMAGFLAVEGVSTDDGKVFFNLFQDQDHINFACAQMTPDHVMDFIALFKTVSKTPDFQHQCVKEDSEQGFAVWASPEPSNFVVACFAGNSGPLPQSVVDFLDQKGTPLEPTTNRKSHGAAKNGA